jgi:hypothetical protein
MRFTVSAFLSVFAGVALAAPPDGYYASVDLSSPESLRISLHEIIDDHTKIPYTSSAIDTWDVINLADEDPLNSGNVLTIYKNATYPKVAGGNDKYNREHAWPKSYGFPGVVQQITPTPICIIFLLQTVLTIRQGVIFPMVSVVRAVWRSW